MEQHIMIFSPLMFKVSTGNLFLRESLIDWEGVEGDAGTAGENSSLSWKD
jgi:hypothetical protein